MISKSVFIAIVITFLAMGFLGCKNQKSEDNARLNSIAQTDIVLGQIDSLESKILGETRQFWVYVPESYKTNKVGELKYSVVYTLDGSVQFHPLSSMIRYMSSGMNNTFPEMIVVGIINTNRSKDLTPTKGESILPDGRKIPMPSGNGSAFLDFLEKELIPYIENKYPATNYRTFLGHSLGGLIVLQALTTRPNLFNNYLAVDASLWWNDATYIKKVDSIMATNQYKNKSLYLAIANNLMQNQTLKEALADTTQASLHLRASFEFANLLDKKDNGLQTAWKYYEAESHGTVPFKAHYDAFRFFFDWYEFDMLKIMDPNYRPTSAEYVGEIKKHFAGISKNMGYEVLPPGESMIMTAQALYAYLADFNKAHALLDMNIENYPKSPKVYEAKADCFVAEQKIEQAIEYYTKAISFGENEVIQSKLDALKESGEMKVKNTNKKK